MSAPPSARIARAYYAIAGVYTLSASLIWGINTLFLLHAGLSLVQVFLANAVFTGAMALFELPTGIIADTAGRRKSFLLSVAILAVGTALYAALPSLGGGFGAFCAVSVLLGLGYTFYSGAVEAWVVDALGAVGDTTPVDQVLARGAIVTSGAMLAGTLLGGLLGTVDLVLPYIARCGLLVLAFVLGVTTMWEGGFVSRRMLLREVPAEMGRVGRESVAFGWRNPRVRLAILGGAVPAIFLEWGFHAWQPFFLGLLHSDAVWINGAIAAAVAMSSIVGNWIVERAANYCGRRTTLLLASGAVYSLAAMGVGLVPSFWPALGLYLIAMASVGVMAPVRQAYIHASVPKEQRATILSLASLWASGASMGGQAGLGWLSGRTSLATGYVVGGAATILALPLVLALRRRPSAADLILGKAGSTATCHTMSAPMVVAVSAVRDAPV